MRLNLLFSLISTTQFGAFVRNESVEFEQLPSNPARDFFLRNVDFEPHLNGVQASEKARTIRELHQMVYLLNIRTLSMKLDKSDWRLISRVMLSLVAESLSHKFHFGDAALQTNFVQQIKANLG